MIVRIVLQARFDSNRLAGKALLPLGGMPMVILAAKRAMRSGFEVVVATSHNSSDNAIVSVCDAAAVPVVRGSLENVYERFIAATADLDDKAIIVRLTADNVFPDADFVQGIVDQLQTSRVSYVAPRWPQDGLPYGVAAEAFRLEALRQASPESAGDAEHVTPALRRAAGNPGVANDGDLSHLRATVDTADDYSNMIQVFEGIDNAVEIGWRELCNRLVALPVPRVPWRRREGTFQSQMTLGGAQFGMPYGIANETGEPSQREVTHVIHSAIDHGVTHIDTAQLYGESEMRIGAALKGGWRSRVHIVTKLGPIEADAPEVCSGAVERSIEASLRALGGECLDTLLLHRAETRIVANGAVWNALLDLKRRGLVRRLGISVQDRAEFDAAAADPDIETIQLPFNLLDSRWDSVAPRRDNLVIHARSVFLQGLLAGGSSAKWPRVPGVDVRSLIETLQQLATELGRRSVADLAVAFARAQSWIDSLVIGVDNRRQLEANFELFAAPPLDDAAVATVRRRLPVLPDQLLNPAQWPIR
jgi:spore coat polysaccharide biosynthesis protein SpsF